MITNGFFRFRCYFYFFRLILAFYVKRYCVPKIRSRASILFAMHTLRKFSFAHIKHGYAVEFNFYAFFSSVDYLFYWIFYCQYATTALFFWFCVYVCIPLMEKSNQWVIFTSPNVRVRHSIEAILIKKEFFFSLKQQRRKFPISFRCGGLRIFFGCSCIHFQFYYLTTHSHRHYVSLIQYLFFAELSLISVSWWVWNAILSCLTSPLFPSPTSMNTFAFFYGMNFAA